MRVPGTRQLYTSANIRHRVTHIGTNVGVRATKRQTSSQLRKQISPRAPRDSLKAAYLNIRSVREKQEMVKDYIAQENIDVLFLAETWLYPNERPKVIKDLEPDGFRFRSKPR